MLGVLIKFISSLVVLGCLLSLAFALFKRLFCLSNSSSSSNRQGSPKNDSEPEDLSPWQILGVKKGALQEEIEIAYKNKIKANHPDKVASLDPYFHKIANERLKSINEAYQELIKYHKHK